MAQCLRNHCTDQWDDEILNCAACKEYVLNLLPRALSCGHGLCCACVEENCDRTNEGFAIVCPVCQDVTDVEGRQRPKLKKLPLQLKPRNKKKILEFVASATTCGDCERSGQNIQSSYYCNTCCTFLCTVCHIREHRDHACAKLRQGTYKDVCREHDLPFVFVWCGHIRGACYKCLLSSKHEEHKEDSDESDDSGSLPDNVNVIVDFERADIRARCSGLQSLLEEENAVDRDYQLMREAILKTAAVMKKQIDHQATIMVMQLEEQNNLSCPTSLHTKVADTVRLAKEAIGDTNNDTFLKRLTVVKEYLHNVKADIDGTWSRILHFKPSNERVSIGTVRRRTTSNNETVNKSELKTSPPKTRMARSSSLGNLANNLKMSLPVAAKDGPSTCRRCRELNHEVEGTVCKASLETPNQDISVFTGTYNPLSNFYQCQFNLRGERFFNALQAFEFWRAMDCNQREFAMEIKGAKYAKDVKQIKDRMKSVVKKDEECKELMKEVLKAKAFQVDKVRTALLATGTRTLAQAAPGDYFFSTGFTEKDTLHTKPKFWPGRNFVGVALEEVRAELREFLRAPPVRPFPVPVLQSKNVMDDKRRKKKK